MSDWEGPVTHWEGCWRYPAHWQCAAAKVEALEKRVREAERFRMGLRWKEPDLVCHESEILAELPERWVAVLKNCDGFDGVGIKYGLDSLLDAARLEEAEGE